MIQRMAIIADDLTGALDTGVQFLNKGCRIFVLVDISNLSSLSIIDCNAFDILVINTNSRHLNPKEAVARVIEAVRYVKGVGFQTIYKKTDSVLRGNIGSELEAALIATGELYMVFVPAYPRQERFTRKGKQYINNIPISETEFSKDPYNPVRTSSVAKIINQQSSLQVVNVLDKSWPQNLKSEPTILVFDSETDKDIKQIVKLIKEKNMKALAGCAGLAAQLSLNFVNKIGSMTAFFNNQHLVVVSGSMMDTSIRQIHKAKEAGFEHVELADTSKRYSTSNGENAVDVVLAGHQAGKDMIVSMDEIFRNNTAHQIGSLDVSNCLAGFVNELLQSEPDIPLVLIGGDTLMATFHEAGITFVEPVMEIVSGVVLIRAAGRYGTHLLISKSGGLGRENVLLTIRQFIHEHQAL